jgi:hypothetical protein
MPCPYIYPMPLPWGPGAGGEGGFETRPYILVLLAVLTHG